jgi:hypothetical protein
LKRRGPRGQKEGAGAAGVEMYGARGGRDGRFLAHRKDQFLPQVEPAPLLGEALFVALCKQRVGVGQLAEAFRGIVFDRQSGSGPPRHRRQAHGGSFHVLV